jgi:hypothetical protein
MNGDFKFENGGGGGVELEPDRDPWRNSSSYSDHSL